MVFFGRLAFALRFGLPFVDYKGIEEGFDILRAI